MSRKIFSLFICCKFNLYNWIYMLSVFIYSFNLEHNVEVCFWSQRLLPIRVEIDVKLGGTQCNLIISKLKPWLQLLTSKKRSFSLGKDNSQHENSQTNHVKSIMWTCTVSAPEMTIALYSVAGLPLYHVSWP